MGRHGRQPTEREAHFWSKVNKDGGAGCWTWAGSFNSYGYALFFYDGRMRGAHRYAYQVTKGPIPTGLVLDHLCRNRGCLNPDHLEVVDHQTNILRGEGTAARHAAQTHCVNGHPFDSVNTYQRPGRSRRDCKECGRGRGRVYYSRKKETRAA